MELTAAEVKISLQVFLANVPVCPSHTPPPCVNVSFSVVFATAIIKAAPLFYPTIVLAIKNIKMQLIVTLFS